MRRYVLPRLGDCLFISIFAGSLLLGARMLNTDSDLGRHLILGGYVLDTHSIPVQDVLSFTEYGRSRPPYEWLSQVAFAIAYRLLNLDGVVLLASLAIAAAFLVVYLDGVERGRLPISALFITAWAAAASSLHWLTRPHIFSFLLFAIWVRELEQLRTGKRIQLWQFPLLMLVWANTHGAFVLGFLAWAAYTAGWLWQTWHRSAEKGLGRRLLFVGGASLAASLITPDLWHNWDAVLQNRSPYILSRTMETMPPNFSAPGTWSYAGLLVLTIIVLAVLVWRRGARRVVPAHAVLLGGLALMSLVMARNIPFFAIGVAPILSDWLSGALEGRSSWMGLEIGFRQIDISLRGALWPTVVVVGAAGWLSIHAMQTRTYQYQFDPTLFPVQAADWIESQPPAGNMFNDFNWGGYLLYRLWPRHLVYIDSQSDFYGEGLTRQYERIITAQPGWQGYLAASNVHWVIIPPRAPLAASLRMDPSWRLVHEDRTALIFGENGEP